MEDLLKVDILIQKQNKQILEIINFIDQLAITFFTIEYILRLLLSPKKKKFLLDQMNLVDLIAIVPFYI